MSTKTTLSWTGGTMFNWVKNIFSRKEVREKVGTEDVSMGFLDYVQYRASVELFENWERGRELKESLKKGMSREEVLSKFSSEYLVHLLDSLDSVTREVGIYRFEGYNPVAYESTDPRVLGVEDILKYIPSNIENCCRSMYTKPDASVVWNTLFDDEYFGVQRYADLDGNTLPDKEEYLIMDLGCGNGNMLPRLVEIMAGKEKDFTIILVDYASIQLNFANRKIDRTIREVITTLNSKGVKASIEFVNADVIREIWEHGSVKDKTFDLITMNYMTSYIDDVPTLLDNVSQHLSGSLRVVDAFAEHPMARTMSLIFMAGGDFRGFHSRDEFVEVARSKFSKIDVRDWGILASNE